MSSRNNNSGPSLKKKFVGLIKQISQSGGAGGGGPHSTIPRPDTFIHKYLQGWPVSLPHSCISHYHLPPSLHFNPRPLTSLHTP
ncbi:hypothetical protein Pcinc_021850 [Petrolisthes cinctipes]|uniref:Uncharacterized protein n=1 Tax=Petrolisthes cinctipes TaxID=88211 RepID=A0AAE1FGK5_PETCI|nr:hypothetical protein Pcinc_021850 [Petrolisthes cinctipes]